MATEEIEISELEFAEELAGDNLIPVESSTDTKATSLQIVKDWLSSFFVGKTGGETIGGIKTFTDRVNILADIVRTINDDSSTPPSTYVENTILQANDKQGVLNSSLRTGYDANGTVRTCLYAGNAGTNKAIAIHVKTDGSAYATAPTPPVSDNSTQIATTSWVRSSGAVATSKNLADNGYVKMSSGLIIQWGVTNETGSNPIEVTLPTAFTTARYKVATSNYYNSTTNGASTISYSTTKFKIYRNGSANIAWIAIGY